MQDHINALFDGRQCVLRLRRDVLRLFERDLNGSAFDLLRRLTGGQWTRRDVELVLEYATMTDKQADHLAGMPVVVSTGLGMSNRGGSVANLLNTRPIAPYAVLAARVLEATLYGIAAEDAGFDERAELGEVS